ncbi:MAG: phenylacetic acid degradation protein PaaN [Sphingomonadales bacterium]|nr:phenylacetic acid degradation protein PaaN [Sphingomonadales bacterium]
MSYFEQYREKIERAIQANRERTYYAAFPENPKAYPEDAAAQALSRFQASMNTDFTELLQEKPLRFEGEEISPYLQTGLGIRYPVFADKTLVQTASNAMDAWRKIHYTERAGILTACLDRMKERFFDIAYATQHTTGQSFMMAFQAGGPHAADRAMEVIAMGVEELSRVPESCTWDKPMGKFNITLHKTWMAMPRGVALVIGCSTFPTWNTLPGVFASLMTGNSVIVKPHPKAVLPIAIVVAEMQKALNAAGISPEVIQLAPDTQAYPLARELAGHPDVRIIDYTGNTEFGNQLEHLQQSGKQVFTEKAGVNPVILDSATDLKAVCDNLAFSLSLYAGQMCTAPQNFFVSAEGIRTPEGVVTVDAFIEMFTESLNNISGHPKMASGVLATLQQDAQKDRIARVAEEFADAVILPSTTFVNEEFPDARVATPMLLKVDAARTEAYDCEWFGPIGVVVCTQSTADSLKHVLSLSHRHGAISCGIYCTDPERVADMADRLAQIFVPVSVNLTGPIYINQHAAFSDFHVTGGNAAGNASFTDALYLNRRFVWVGQRFAS